MDIKLPLRSRKGKTKVEYLESLETFAESMKKIQEGIDFAMSSRGWCYAVEPYGLDKADFDWLQGQINEARRQGFLEPKFILEEEGHNVKSFNDDDWSAKEWVESEYEDWKNAREKFENCDEDYANASFWDDKDYFIQILVEKSDLKSLFMKVCQKYRIPIANMRGWGSMEQKAEMAQRFKKHEAEGRKPILLACCDFDPPGLGISKALIETFEKNSKFSGWQPDNLVVDRLGLNYEFIKKNKLTWIEGLSTIHKKNLADPNHLFYIRNVYNIRGYIKKYGARKCEANAVVVVPALGRKMLVDKIESYLGKNCYTKFIKKIKIRREEIKELVVEKIEEEDE